MSKNDISSTAPVTAEKLVVFTEGGRGGVGKTTVATLLLDYYQHKGVAVAGLDFDTENKTSAGLSYFYPQVCKVDIDHRDGMDAIIDAVQGEAPIVFADMGARSGSTTFKWFNEMAESLKEVGVAFAAVGVVTTDPGSVESVIEWGKHLKNRVRHIICLNKMADPNEEFIYWNSHAQAIKYRELAKPAVITLESINPQLQNALRTHGATIGQVADKTVKATELTSMKWIIRAQAIRRGFFGEIDREIGAFLP